MTGLEKILAQIKLDADNSCADIKKTTESQCAHIIANAKAQAERIVFDGEKDAVCKYDEIILRAKSTADIESRSVILKTKQEIIASALNSAREYIYNLPDNEYFAVISKMVAKYSEDADGLIYFSARDLARLPKDYDQELSKSAQGNLTIGTSPADIDGGFILTYGGIEVNCGLSSIFSAESERFSDEVAKLLFA